MSHFKRRELRLVNMFWMILIVTQVSSFKRILFKFRNGRHVFNAFHFVGFASFKSKQCLFLVWIVWQSKILF